MNRLRAIKNQNDIYPKYFNTPIADLIGYQNLDKPFQNYTTAELLVGMCMDNRKHLHIPENFAYIIRAGGANLRHSEFKVSYAIAVGGVKAITLIGHNNCGMVNLFERKESFINGLVDDAGWSRQNAEVHFMQFAPLFEIGNEVDFVLSEARRMRKQYPKIIVAPLFYQIEDGLLYHISEDAE